MSVISCKWRVRERESCCCQVNLILLGNKNMQKRDEEREMIRNARVLISLASQTQDFFVLTHKLSPRDSSFTHGHPREGQNIPRGSHFLSRDNGTFFANQRCIHSFILRRKTPLIRHKYSPARPRGPPRMTWPCQWVCLVPVCSLHSCPRCEGFWTPATQRTEGAPAAGFLLGSPALQSAAD